MTAPRRRPSAWLGPWAWLGPCLALAACAGSTVQMVPEPRSFTYQDYWRIYEEWTRESDEFAFGRLEDVLHVTATFEGWEFRWAYVVRYAHDYRLDPEARAEMLRATLDDAREHHRFFVTLVGNKYRESDLTKDRSAWRVLLVDEHGRVTVPVGIEKVRRPNAPDRVYFPSMSPFRHAFRVVFPSRHLDGTPTIAPGASHILLRFTGALGTVDLRWDLQGQPGSGEQVEVSATAAGHRTAVRGSDGDRTARNATQTP